MYLTPIQKYKIWFLKNNAWDEGTVTGTDGRAVIFDCKNEYGLKRPTCDVKKQITENENPVDEENMEENGTEKVEKEDTKEEKETNIPKTNNGSLLMLHLPLFAKVGCYFCLNN